MRPRYVALTLVALTWGWGSHQTCIAQPAGANSALPDPLQSDIILRSGFETPVEMQFWADAFGDGESIPILHTCDSVVPANGITPGLSWTNPPGGTNSFSLIVQDDSFALGMPKWGVHNIPADKTFLMAGEHVNAIPGVVSTTYNAPCPPVGDAPHPYSFNLYAMDATFSFPLPVPPYEPFVTTYDFEAQYAGQILAKSTFDGYYGR